MIGLLRSKIWSKIGSGFCFLTRFYDFWNDFARDFDVDMIFIVFEEDIVLGFVFFDEIALENQAFSGRGSDDGFYVNDLGNHLFFGEIERGIFHKITFHTTLKIDRFSDVENFSCTVKKLIHTRKTGDMFQFLFERHTVNIIYSIISTCV